MSTSDSKILQHECRVCGYISAEFPCGQCGSVRLLSLGGEPYTTIADYPHLYPGEIEENKCEQCGTVVCPGEPCPSCTRVGTEFFDQIWEGDDSMDNFDNPYWILKDTLMRAYWQAERGKGRERHAEKDEPFESQKVCEITRRVGLGFPLGQAIKKAEESLRLDTEAGVAELFGAINYLAAAIIVMEEGEE
jgi:hypothetical protein